MPQRRLIYFVLAIVGLLTPLCASGETHAEGRHRSRWHRHPPGGAILGQDVGRAIAFHRGRGRRVLHAGFQHCRRFRRPVRLDSGIQRSAQSRRSFRGASAAVAIWQEFVQDNPSSPDLSLAQDELKHWKDLADENAEKVDGRWIGGDQLKQMVRQSNDLIDQAWDLWNQHETLQSVDKLKGALKIYPNSFTANFLMGFIEMDEKQYDDAMQYYAEAVRIQPQSIPALNNLAIVYYFHSYYDESLDTFQKAVQIRDSQVIVQNMVNALQDAGVREIVAAISGCDRRVESAGGKVQHLRRNAGLHVSSAADGRPAPARQRG